MEIKSQNDVIKLNIIILTYNRPEELKKCLNSIIRADKSNIELKIFIYDNCSDVNPQNTVEDFKKYFDNIFFYRHKVNIQGDPNCWFSISDQINKGSDYLTFISDDDYIMDNYFLEMKEYLQTKEEIVINHSSIVHSVKKNIFEVRSLPSRRLNLLNRDNNKFIGMVDSKVFSSFTINTNLAKKSYEAFSKKFQNKEYLKYRYPLCALSSFTDKYIFINSPTYVHLFENEIYWGKINYFEDFIINRIEMFNDCYDLGAYSLNTKKSLLIDFISGQKILYIFKIITKYRSLLKPFSLMFYLKLLLRLLVTKLSLVIRIVGKLFITIDNKFFKKIGPYY